jgi:RimJ/RimL family protein N-acetyltransferase
MSTDDSSLNSVVQMAGVGDIDEARAALERLIGRENQRATNQERQRWRQWQLKLARLWWEPLVGGGMVLRRTRAEDADFYRRSFADPEFVHKYNRQRPWSGDLERALDRAGRLAPLDAGALHWVVCRLDGTRCGLASLTSINLSNARAEYSIGYPTPPGPLDAALATLLAFDFAFFRLRLNKLFTYVYAGNDAALHNSVRVGLRHEGLLKDHFWLPPGTFVDVNAMGLTRSQLLADDRLVGMARRRLGLDWSNSGPR